ncbi:MAG TPA: NAD(P)H-dependent oxidoreductase [Chitinophagaceae bacterium]
MKIAIISGSPRLKSTTKRVALHLLALLRKDTNHEVELIDLSSWVISPVEKVITSVEDAPAEMRPLAEAMFSADAFIIVTPEYNGSYSPSMQIIFDHFPKQHHKVFGLVTASPGVLGGVRAAMQLQQFVLALFGIASPYMLITPQVDKKFNNDGVLIDETFGKSIALFIKEFLWLGERVVAHEIEV